jgi:hypothetical protein
LFLTSNAILHCEGLALDFHGLGWAKGPLKLLGMTAKTSSHTDFEAQPFRFRKTSSPANTASAT